METHFEYDVFLSHSSQDKETVRDIAQRLRADGVRVWFDEWEIQPGDSIPAKIEYGLEHARVLLLCMSAAAFGSDWTQLESHTFRFRDPLNRDRRFIPLRLDDVEPKGSLAQFRYIDWREPNRQSAYEHLLTACRIRLEDLPLTLTRTKRLEPELMSMSLGYTDHILSIALSDDGRYALSGSADHTVRFWDIESEYKIQVMEGHTGSIHCVALSSDGCYALSGSADKTIRLWNTTSGHSIWVSEVHAASVLSAALSPNGRYALSGSADNTVRLWELESNKLLRVMEGHTDSVNSVTFTADERYILSGSADRSIRLWDVESGRLLRIMNGHTDSVLSVMASNNGARALSGSADKTVRLWDLESGNVLQDLRGHTNSVLCISFSTDGDRGFSISSDQDVRMWDLNSGQTLRKMENRPDIVKSVAISQTGTHAISGFYDYTLQLWDIQSGRTLRMMDGHRRVISSVAFNTHRNFALSSSRDWTVRLWELESGRTLQVMEGHLQSVLSVDLSSDGRYGLSGSRDRTVRLWDTESGQALQVMEGHTGSVNCVTLDANGNRAISGSSDKTLIQWSLDSGRAMKVMEGHTDSISSVALSKDGCFALSGSVDKTVRLWDLESGHTLQVMNGHTNSVHSVTFSNDGRYALSGSADKTVRLWDLKNGRMLWILEGHTDSVRSVALSSDGRHVLSGSTDTTVRLWDLESRRMLQVLEGHTGSVTNVSFNADGSRYFSSTSNGVLRIWHSVSAVASLTETNQVDYMNAKVLLVGNSGAGKTGLSNRLALDEYRETDPTIGAWATHWQLQFESENDAEQEIWLWDFGGQADQRLIHQLYMDQTQVVALVFDPQKPEIFEGLHTWNRDLSQAATGDFKKLLVAGRIDAGGLYHVSHRQVKEFAKEHGFDAYIETSAKENIGCAELKAAIKGLIDWKDIAKRTTPTLFQHMKEEILTLKEEGRLLMRFHELREALALRLEEKSFSDAELAAVISLLIPPGVVWELGFGTWLLLAPELINAYAQAVIRTLGEDERELGCITEESVRTGKLSYARGFQRLSEGDEQILLLAMLKLLVENSLCLSEHTESGTLLVFPSYARRHRPEPIENISVAVSYQFEGFLDDIYATLVVRLHRTGPFKTGKFWNGAAEFQTMTNRKLGVKLIRDSVGKGELLVYFDPDIPVSERMIFSKYVQEHLFRKAHNPNQVKRLRHWFCENCGERVANRERAMQRLNDHGKSAKIICVNCEIYIYLWDEMEQAFADPETRRHVEELETIANRRMAEESQLRALVGEVISTVNEANQIARELPVSDHSISMEIIFKDDTGKATENRLYLLFGSNRHLPIRQNNETQTNQTPDHRHIQYWVEQKHPVMWIALNEDGEIYWRDIRETLRELIEEGIDQVQQVSFSGERFDVASVRRWRERMLPLTLKTLHEVLLNSFTNMGELERMVGFELGENLLQLVQDGSLQDVMFRLLQWADAQGRIPELIHAAHRANSTNKELAALDARIDAWG